LTNLKHINDNYFYYIVVKMKTFVVFPARNEAKTIAQCIEIAKKSKYEPEILVVDGNSSDKTREEAKSAGARVINQSKSIFPAKGRAMKDGVQEAIRRGADCIVFLDADIVNLTPEWVDLLAEPVIEKACDMSRGYYRRAEYDGAVTKLVAKPLSWVFFPEIAHFNQPLSGEICATSELFKALLKNRDWPNGWGVDIWLLIEAAMKDYHIVEVYLGTKIHTSRNEYLVDVVRLAKMAEQVSLTTFKEAIKYKRVDNVKGIRL
jgi:glycosyltransferase involved in cell wall biosynthesis